MKIEVKHFTYVFPVVLTALAAWFQSVGMAYAACLSLGLCFAKGIIERYTEQKTVKTDDQLKHKVEQLEAAISAMVTREKARGW